MHHGTDEHIRERAYALWQADGCPEGKSDAYWVIAEQQVRAAESQPHESNQDIVMDDGEGEIGVITAGSQSDGSQSDGSQSEGLHSGGGQSDAETLDSAAKRARRSA